MADENAKRVADRWLSAAVPTPKDMGRVNMFIMDWEMDGGTLPPGLQKISDLRRKLTDREKKKLFDWFNRTAPGDY